MTSNHSHHSHDVQIEQVIQDLKEHNVRITPQRRAVLKFLINSSHHPSVEEIYNNLLADHPGMSLATVYNNLNIFVKIGIVKEMKFAGVTSRYDFMGHTHYHIICEKCGRVVDFSYNDLASLNETVQEQTGFTVNKTNLEVFGLCPTCQSSVE